MKEPCRRILCKLFKVASLEAKSENNCFLFRAENATRKRRGTVFTRKKRELPPQTKAVLWRLWQRGRSLPAVQSSRASQQHGSTTIVWPAWFVEANILSAVCMLNASLAFFFLFLLLPGMGNWRRWRRTAFQSRLAKESCQSETREETREEVWQESKTREFCLMISR